MQARGLLNYRLKYCWPKVIYCICQPNELEREIKKKSGGESKNLGGHGPPRPSLELPLTLTLLAGPTTAFEVGNCAVPPDHLHSEIPFSRTCNLRKHR